MSSLRKLKEYEENYKAPDEKPKIDDKDWPKMFESINDYLTRINGEQNLPLAYVIRCNTAVPPDEDDPSTNYPMAITEMIAWAPHGTAATLNAIYTANSAKVADKLSEIVRDTVAWTYVKNHVHSWDGHAAYYAMFNHYLGPNNVDHQASQSEKALMTLTYNGEGHHWNFKKYVTGMKKHHQILEGLVLYRYSSINECTKVRYLRDGIKTDKFEALFPLRHGSEMISMHALHLLSPSSNQRQRMMCRLTVYPRYGRQGTSLPARIVITWRNNIINLQMNRRKLYTRSVPNMDASQLSLARPSDEEAEDR